MFIFTQCSYRTQTYINIYIYEYNMYIYIFYIYIHVVFVFLYMYVSLQWRAWRSTEFSFLEYVPLNKKAWMNYAFTTDQSQRWSFERKKHYSFFLRKTRENRSYVSASRPHYRYEESHIRMMDGIKENHSIGTNIF